jgi:hypothetical protein
VDTPSQEMLLTTATMSSSVSGLVIGMMRETTRIGKMIGMITWRGSRVSLFFSTFNSTKRWAFLMKSSKTDLGLLVLSDGKSSGKRPRPTICRMENGSLKGSEVDDELDHHS